VLLEDVHVTAKGKLNLAKHWTEGNISLVNVTCTAPEKQQIVKAEEAFYCKAI
jgi:hypothetical protein